MQANLEIERKFFWTKQEPPDLTLWKNQMPHLLMTFYSGDLRYRLITRESYIYYECCRKTKIRPGVCIEEPYDCNATSFLTDKKILTKLRRTISASACSVEINEYPDGTFVLELERTGKPELMSEKEFFSAPLSRWLEKTDGWIEVTNDPLYSDRQRYTL